MHSLIRSFTHSFTHSFVHLFICSLTHSFIRSFTHSFGHSFAHSIIRSLTHSFTFIRAIAPSLLRRRRRTSPPGSPRSWGAPPRPAPAQQTRVAAELGCRPPSRQNGALSLATSASGLRVAPKMAFIAVSCIPSLAPSFSPSFIQSLVHSSTQPFTYSFILYTYSFTEIRSHTLFHSLFVHSLLPCACAGVCMCKYARMPMWLYCVFLCVDVHTIQFTSIRILRYAISLIHCNSFMFIPYICIDVHAYTHTWRH